MIPFVRTIVEAEGVVALLGGNGLRRGENDLQVIMMCELPSNASRQGHGTLVNFQLQYRGQYLVVVDNRLLHFLSLEPAKLLRGR